MNAIAMHLPSAQADGRPGTDTASQVTRLVALQCGRPEVALDQRLAHDLGFDSLDRACLCVAMEDVFGMPTPVLYADSFERVSDVVAYVERGGAPDHITS